MGLVVSRVLTVKKEGRKGHKSPVLFFLEYLWPLSWKNILSFLGLWTECLLSGKGSSTKFLWDFAGLILKKNFFFSFLDSDSAIVAGALIGAIVAAVIICVIVWVLTKKAKKKKSSSNEMQ